MNKQQISNMVDEPKLTQSENEPVQEEGLHSGPFSHKHFLTYAMPTFQATTVRPGRTTRSVGTLKLKRIPLGVKILASVMVVLLVASAAAFAVWYTHLPLTSTVYQIGSKQQVSQDIGGGGLVFPHQQFDLSYPATNRVMTLMVKAGDQVKLSQPLLKLDSSQIDATVNQAASAISIAQSYLNSIDTTGNLVTVAQAQQTLQVAQDRYNALIEQTSSLTFHGGLLLSPLKGVVTNVNIDAGEIFTAGTVLLTIMDLSTVIVHAKMPLSNLSQVRVGLPALVMPSALPNLNMNGVVTSIIPQADPQTDTFEADITVTRPQQQILPGMSAFVSIQTPITAYVVPRLVVLNPDHDAVVFVVRNKYAYLQQVQIIGRSVDNIYIVGALMPGDYLIVRPLDSLYDGQAVTMSQVIN